MYYPFFSSTVFSHKIEWLNGKVDIDRFSTIEGSIAWLWDTLPNYQPLTEIYTPQILVPEDKTEEKRLMEAYPWVASENIWLQSMVETDNSLREKVALFWHQHIPSSRGRKTNQGILLLEIYRKYGLGNLRELLIQLISTPALMYFLDLGDSSKEKPNENFARELMELFLLGEGNYTLQDVKEVARAFTGRRFDQKNFPYPYFLDKSAYDDGVKTIFGKTGNYDGEGVIDLILERPQAAYHITRAALKFFFSDQPPAKMVSDCADAYFKSGYEMSALLNAMFRHPEFSNPAYRFSKVKTPVELIVAFQRQTGLRTVGLKTAYFFMRYAGQTLFSPPTVAGWPGGEDWLRGERLLHRLFLPGTLIAIANRKIPKASVAYKVYSRLSVTSKRKYRYIADARWDADAFFSALKESDISVSEWLLGEKRSENNLLAILQYPEYQYC